MGQGGGGGSEGVVSFGVGRVFVCVVWCVEVRVIRGGSRAKK